MLIRQPQAPRRSHQPQDQDHQDQAMHAAARRRPHQNVVPGFATQPLHRPDARRVQAVEDDKEGHPGFGCSPQPARDPANADSAAATRMPPLANTVSNRYQACRRAPPPRWPAPGPTPPKPVRGHLPAPEARSVGRKSRPPSRGFSCILNTCLALKISINPPSQIQAQARHLSRHRPAR